MKNRKNRLISFLLTLVMLTGVLAAVPPDVFAAPNAQTRTLMLYIVGSNLEGGWGCATWNLVQSMEADYDENLKFIVMTGGSEEWHTEEEYLDGAKAVDAEYDQIWKLEGKRDGEEHGKMKLLEPTGIEGFEKANMGKPETLVAFVDYCYENYPADQYDLILWDHGGGFGWGFGFDDRFTDGGPITVPQMADGFGKTKLIKDGKKFEIIDFDACLMAGPEIAAALAPYADYLVASAETEPGYGQEYTGWLNALRENPGMNGFELGKIIVDGLAAFYTEEIEEATLSVIDLKNFTERLMPLISELDDILLREAKLLGERNGRFNFYDELYSLRTAYEYAGEGYSLYDLGDLAGSLSAPQSEMDNAEDGEIDALKNAYTGTMLKILAVLVDSDGSRDDVIYSSESASTNRTVDGYSVRGLDGEFLPPDENGYLTIDPTGFNIFFGDGNLYNAYSYTKNVNDTIKLLDDGPTLGFLEKRGLAAAYYALIVRFGQIVSELSNAAEGPVTWAEAEEYVQQSEDVYDSAGIPILIKFIADQDDDFSSTDEVKAYFSKIVDQQAGEALRKDKIVVKKLIDPDGDSNFYQVTIRDASPQSLMSVLSAAKLKVGNYESPEFEEILKIHHEGKTYDEVFPDGVCFYSPDYEGTLDHYRYYEALDDSNADIYQRVYSDPTSVWIVPQVDTYCFVLTDQNGTEHPARIYYRDRSRTRATLPIRINWANGNYNDAYLVISYGENGWQTDGVSFYSDTERSCYPMDSDFLDGAKYTTAACLPDYNGNAYLNPISQFCEIDVSKKDWGISLGWKKIGEIDEIVNSVPAHFVADVYGYRIDVTELFTAADEAAKQGDVAYTVDCADFTVAEAVYDGAAQTPKVTATLKGTALTEGVDYKVLYDGSSDPGGASLAVIGIGNFYGVLELNYTIKDSLAVKVDGTEIGKDQFSVNENTGAVTLKDAFVKTLDPGEHTLTVIISGKETTTNFTVPASGEQRPVSPQTGDNSHSDKETTTDFTVPASGEQRSVSPQTGDNSHIELWIMLMTVSAGCGIALFVLGRRRRVFGK